MDNKNIESVFIITKNIDGNSVPSELIIFSNDKKAFRTPYDFTKHDELVVQFLESKGIDMSDPDFLAKTEDIFEIYPENTIERGIIDEYIEKECVLVDNLEELSEEPEELSEVKKDTKFSKGQKIAAGAVATTAALGAVAAVIATSANAGEHEKGKKDNSSKDTTEVDVLLNKLPVDDERRVFFETVDTVLEKLNSLVLDKEVFALEEDKDAILKFTTDEIISAMIVLNNYSREELKEIFGDKELNSAQILSNYQTFAFKMSIYSMNGKAPSQISLLIRDEENRTWFETIEKALVEFNKNQTNENADKLIRLFAYFYQHGINGKDNLENDEAAINGVKNLVLNMMRGYYDANVEEDYKKYLVVSSVPSDFDDKYRDNELSQVQKGEKLKFYLDEAEKGVCTISVIEEYIKATIDNLEFGIDEITQIKLELVEALSDAGELELAKKVLEEGLSDQVLAQFENSSKKAKKALELYRTSLSAIDSALPSYLEIKTELDNVHGPFEEIKDDVLYNNRIRGLEKISVNTNSGNVITKEEWNNMSSDEKIEYAKEHGEVISTTTQTKEEKVDYNDFTPSEQQEADKQQEAQENKGAKENAYKDGIIAAKSFATQDNLFNYSFIDPLNGKAVRNDGSLYDFIRLTYIYNGSSITMSNSKIQTRYSSDLAAFKKTTNNSELIASYQKGWKDGMNAILASAIADGKEGRKDWLEAKAAKDKNNQTTTEKQESTTNKEETTIKPTEPTTNKEETTTQKQETTTQDNTPVVTEKPDQNVIDPNLNPTIADSDEGFEDIYDENYGGYVSSEEFALYTDAVIEETTTKVLIK